MNQRLVDANIRVKLMFFSFMLGSGERPGNSAYRPQTFTACRVIATAQSEVIKYRDIISKYMTMVVLLLLAAPAPRRADAGRS